MVSYKKIRIKLGTVKVEDGQRRGYIKQVSALRKPKLPVPFRAKIVGETRNLKKLTKRGCVKRKEQKIPLRIKLA